MYPPYFLTFTNMVGLEVSDLTFLNPPMITVQVIPPIGAEGLVGSCRLFLGPGFRLAARWNRLVETVKTRKKREKTGKKWARYGLKNVDQGS